MGQPPEILIGKTDKLIKESINILTGVVPIEGFEGETMEDINLVCLRLAAARLELWKLKRVLQKGENDAESTKQY